jgi:small subunit ribosomal protein S17
MEAQTNKEKNTVEEKKGKVFSGVVVSDKMKDTVVVSVSRYVKHPKYRKYIRRMKKFHADDKGNTHEVGDKVKIQECRPMSKTKCFKVV